MTFDTVIDKKSLRFPVWLTMRTLTDGAVVNPKRQVSLPLSANAGCERINDPAATVVVDAASSRREEGQIVAARV